MDNGAELKRNFEVTSINESQNGFIIKSQKDSVEARFIINCAGIYSDKIAKLIGDDSFEVYARRGEYILLDKECGGIVTHTIFRTPTKMGKGILVSPTVDQNLLLGPTSVNINDKENKATTQDGLCEIIKNSQENLNFVPLSKTITSFCGLRAVGSTGDFIINSPKKQFINAAGIESPGLSASPAIAEYIVELLTEQGLKLIKNQNYNPIRESGHKFFDASTDEKNKIIKANPAYGRIVCRCEGITEGEIIDAIRRNPGACDLDGVKRRTRAQMGRCQGGFCGPYIAEILSQELGIPFNEVTKFGGKSKINVAKTKGGEIL